MNKVAMMGLISVMLMACGSKTEVVQGPTCRAEGLRIVCPDGSSIELANGVDGADGQDGAQGPKGDTGATGPAGQAGQNGSSVLMVKLCKNAPESYPTNFAEYGMCIDNKLYAVYYTAQASFLARLMPGMYRTTTGGNDCSFQVLNGCEVQ